MKTFHDYLEMAQWSEKPPMTQITKNKIESLTKELEQMRKDKMHTQAVGIYNAKMEALKRLKKGIK